MAGTPPTGMRSTTPSGHVWQGRYYSCPLDVGHLWEALRYAELNPVRAAMVTRAPDWPWSSAAVPCGTASVAPWLDMGDKGTGDKGTEIRGQEDVKN
jgi:hypothetical protein